MKALIVKWGIGVILVGLVYCLGYETARSDFSQLILLYSTFFIIYLGIFHFAKTQKTLTFFVGIGILLRLLLVFTIPNFSDDLYRFIWDGRLLTQGLNPFDHLPSYYIETNKVIPGLTPELYQQLNSPNYFTIYPPVNQVIFAMTAWLFPTSIWGSSLVMKSFLFVFEAGSIFLIVQLLRHFKLPAKNVLLYALNPLIIIEITGNIHFEGAMIFFLLLAIWLIAVQKKWVLSAIAFALSVASKLLPLMFLPLLIRRIGNAGTSFPLWRGLGGGKERINLNSNGNDNGNGNELLPPTPSKGGEDLGNTKFFKPIKELANFIKNRLYFQKFEFNGSLYYFFRWIGFQVKGYNIIGTLGPVLAVSALTGILLITLLEGKTDWSKLFERMLFAVCCYLFCSATVHPWYVAMPIVFCLFTRFRFPILWSGLIFLTYINYSYGEYFENLWMVGVEYVLVFGYLIYELINRRKMLI